MPPTIVQPDEGDQENNSTCIDIPSKEQAETLPLTQSDAARRSNRETHDPSPIDSDGATTRGGEYTRHNIARKRRSKAVSPKTASHLSSDHML